MLCKRNALTIVEGLIVAAIVGVLALLLLAGVQRTGLPSPRLHCINNLKWIALALHGYYESHGHLPPAYTVDEQGNRLHSWRTLILPYLEQQPLFDSIDFTKPWDDPANAKAYAAVVEVYQCPASNLHPGMTTYLAPVGPDWSFTAGEPHALDVIDDETVLVLEVDPKRAVHWMSPYDFDNIKAMPFDADIEGVHPTSWMVALSNGQVMLIDRQTPREEIHRMLSIQGGEEEPR